MMIMQIAGCGDWLNNHVWIHFILGRCPASSMTTMLSPMLMWTQESHKYYAARWCLPWIHETMKPCRLWTQYCPRRNMWMGSEYMVAAFIGQVILGLLATRRPVFSSGVVPAITGVCTPFFWIPTELIATRCYQFPCLYFIIDTSFSLNHSSHLR